MRRFRSVKIVPLCGLPGDLYVFLGSSEIFEDFEDFSAKNVVVCYAH